MVSGVTYPNTLRTLYGSQGQMGLQLVAEMHISPVNGDTVWKKKEAQWSFSPSTRLPFLLSFVIINPLLTPPQTLSSHPAVTELPPAWVISTAAAEKLPGIYASGCERWPEAWACVCLCSR